MDASSQGLAERPQVKQKRRMRSNAEKRRIVEETFIDGTSIAAVARRHDMNSSLLFNWRRLYQQGLLEHSREPATAKLLAVRIEPDVVKPVPIFLSEIEIDLPGDVCVRVRGRVDVRALADILAVLR
jgi:transposase